MDADQISGNDGDAVVDWLDISGAAKHYGQNTGTRQPTLKVNLYNGHRAVRFGTNKCLIPDPNPRTYGAANTLICVCTPSTNTDQYILRGTQTGGGPAFISLFLSRAFEYFDGNGLERGTFATSASGLHILTVTHTDDSGNYILYYDGVQVVSSAVSGSADWNTHNCSIIGALTAGSSNYNGDIAYIIHFNANHAGTAGLTNLHNALKSRFGIS